MKNKKVSINSVAPEMNRQLISNANLHSEVNSKIKQHQQMARGKNIEGKQGVKHCCGDTYGKDDK